MKTIQVNMAEIKRIENIIKNHCMFGHIEFIGGTEYHVVVTDGVMETHVKSANKTRRASLCDLAMYLEKAWVHSNEVEPLESRIKKVQKYRNENNLHLSKGFIK